MVKDAFGEKVKDMYEVQALATAPEAQGRGYGSALVRTVTDMVGEQSASQLTLLSMFQGDADGHDVWLITSDAYGFYETLGFSVIGYTAVGTDNPKWKGKPVGVRIVGLPAVTLMSHQC